jgi:hypothetical protein
MYVYCLYFYYYLCKVYYSSFERESILAQDSVEVGKLTVGLDAGWNGKIEYYHLLI